jgi:Cu(I)/Ag(I) efflux system membrane fusion protein
VEGWIESLSVRAEGERVTRGQVLFELFSPTLVNAQEEFLASLGSSSPRLLRASRERLAALGMDASEVERLERERRVRQRVPFVAGADGYVSFLGIREGAFVTPATNVLTIAGLDSVWVHAEVLERQANWVEAGQRAEVLVEHAPDARWQGVVDLVYPEVDPVTRTLKLRLRIDNAGRALRPNLFTRVIVFATGTGPVVSIPREALIRGGRGDRVVVALGDGRFRAQPVEVGIESGDLVEIRTGLSVGDRVVTSGQFLIDSESNIDSALGRLSGESADGGMDHGSMDHGEMGRESMDHSGMDHGSMDHGGMDHGSMDHGEMGGESMDHSGMEHGSMDHGDTDNGDGEAADEHEGHRQ